ncbi:hypothetical protein [Halosimplex amylolyticum]|uniref:hypothetical protein n=1 Tax=Halosimplex amylolyticum TaxID=3396616 RepID=UPI003F556596
MRSPAVAYCSGGFEVVVAAVGLAATDAVAVSRVFVAWLAKRLGVAPAEIRATDAATDGDGVKR